MNQTIILDAETLELLGLSEKDLAVYEALLRLGSAPLRRVAEEAGLNRGTAYDALKRLLQNGLVSYVDAKTHRYFVAQDPQTLRRLATHREVALRESRLSLEAMLPRFEELMGSEARRPAVRYFEGEEGIRDMLDDVLKTTERAESMYRIYSSAAVRDLIAAAAPRYTSERIRRGVTVRAVALGEGGTTSGLDERRWLPGEAGAPCYIFLYGTKTATVSTDEKKKLFGVVIDDAAIAATQIRIFDAVWKTLA